MIQLIGHNSIIAGVANKLQHAQKEVRVYGLSKPVGLDEAIFTQVRDVFELEVALGKSKTPVFRLSAGAPWLFPKAFLDKLSDSGSPMFNIHGTDLPLNRGGTVVSWLILNGQRLGHATVHQMTEEPDAGPLLSSREFLYPHNCRLPVDFIEVYKREQVRFALELCDRWFTGNLKLQALSQQTEYLSSYWPRLMAEQSAWIDWSWPGEHIERFICAFDDPYDGASTTWRGQTISLKKAFFQPDVNRHPYQHGLVFRKNVEIPYLSVSVQGGTLFIGEASVDGNDVMMQMAVGDRLQTSADRLFEAQKRVVKGKNGLQVQSDWRSK